MSPPVSIVSMAKRYLGSYTLISVRTQGYSRNCGGQIIDLDRHLSSRAPVRQHGTGGIRRKPDLMMVVVSVQVLPSLDLTCIERSMFEP
jgi:hypothetical protein